jgi:hypothetical protein
MSFISMGFAEITLIPHWGSAYILWSPQSNTSDAINVLKSKFGDELASFLLVARVNRDLRTFGDGSVTGILSLVVVRTGLCFFYFGILLLGLIRELLDARVRHNEKLGKPAPRCFSRRSLE